MRQKNTLFYFFLMLCSLLTHSYSQSKKILFANIEGEYISKKEFNKSLKNGFYAKSVQNDSLIVNYLNARVFSGKLNSIEYFQFIKNLEKITNTTLDSSKTIIIHQYKTNNKILKNDLNHRRYWSYVKTNNHKIEPILLISNNVDINLDSNKHLYIDKNDFLNNLLFKDSNFNFNHMFIKPDGSFKIYHGEHNILLILDSAV